MDSNWPTIWLSKYRLKIGQSWTKIERKSRVKKEYQKTREKSIEIKNRKWNLNINRMYIYNMCISI